MWPWGVKCSNATPDSLAYNTFTDDFCLCFPGVQVTLKRFVARPLPAGRRRGAQHVRNAVQVSKNKYIDWLIAGSAKHEKFPPSVLISAPRILPLILTAARPVYFYGHNKSQQAIKLTKSDNHGPP